MAQLVEDCPRCGSRKTTFDVGGSNRIGHGANHWQLRFEAFSTCRHCSRSTIFVLELAQYEKYGVFAREDKNELATYKGSLSADFVTGGYINLKNNAKHPIPQYLPAHIEAAFTEGATCSQVQCHNAAGTMFRLCVDRATQDLLPGPSEATNISTRQRRDLGLRLQWLFDNKLLPEDLHSLAQCIKEDGNDGAHRGSLTATDVEDMLDFTTHLLERRYTIPGRVADATARRAARPR